MVPKRLRMFVAGLVAFLVGMPLADKAFAGYGIGGMIGDVIDTSINASAGGS